MSALTLNQARKTALQGSNVRRRYQNRATFEKFAHTVKSRHDQVVAAAESSALGHLPNLLDSSISIGGSDPQSNFTDDWESSSWTLTEKRQATKYYDPKYHSRQAHRDPTIGNFNSFEEHNAFLHYLSNPINREVHDDIHAVLDDDRMEVDHQHSSPHHTRPLYSSGDPLVDRRLKATFGDRDTVLPRTAFDVQLEEWSRANDPIPSSGPSNHTARSAPFYPPRTLTPRLAEDPVNETATMRGVTMPVPHRQFTTLPYAHLRGTANHFDSIYTDTSVVLQQEREPGIVDSAIPDTTPAMYFESKAYPHHHEYKMKWWQPIWEEKVRFVNRGQQLSRMVQWQRHNPETTMPRWWYDNILKAFTHEHTFLAIPETAVHGQHFEPWEGAQPAWKLPTFNFPLRPRFQKFWPPAANNDLPGGAAPDQQPGFMTWPPQRLADLAELRKMDPAVKSSAAAMPLSGGNRTIMTGAKWWAGAPDSPNSFWGASKAAGGDWKKTGRPTMYPVPPQLYDFAFPYNRPIGKRKTMRDGAGRPLATAIPFGNDDVSTDMAKKK